MDKLRQNLTIYDKLLESQVSERLLGGARPLGKEENDIDHPPNQFEALKASILA